MIPNAKLLDEGILIIDQINILLQSRSTDTMLDFQLYFKKEWLELENISLMKELKTIEEFYLKNVSNISYLKVLQSIDSNIVKKYDEVLEMMNYLFLDLDLSQINIKISKHLDLLSDTFQDIQQDLNDWQHIDKLLLELKIKFQDLSKFISNIFVEDLGDIFIVLDFIKWFESTKLAYNTHWFINEAPAELNDSLQKYSRIATSMNDEKFQAIGTALQVREAQLIKKNTKVFKQQDIEENIGLTYKLIGASNKLASLELKRNSNG